MSNFITNENEKSLAERLEKILSVSQQIRALVGFCYFDGFLPLYNALRNNNQIIFKLLIGLDIKLLDKLVVEVEQNYKDNYNKQLDNFLEGFVAYFRHPMSDKQFVYDNAKLLIELIKHNRLIIRKTKKPNHSKIYLFDLDKSQIAARNTFITGSSNLTRSGLVGQEEFNVEIKDYGYEEASRYFEERWQEALPITESEERKQKFIHTLEKRTHLREVTPFEAYAYILKSYLDSYQFGDAKLEIEKIFIDKNYKPFRYQLDAIKQAIPILNAHNGVLIADVVGLGKSVVASVIARLTGRRGIVLCPPGLIGDEAATTGWRGYLKDFSLHDWSVFSTGKLDTVINAIEGDDTIECVIIDEVHRFRNQNTQSYEQLKCICNGKKVIALTATPFNNKPHDLLAILKLFVNTRRSTLTLEDDLEFVFNKIDAEFRKLHYIKKYRDHKDSEKRNRAETYLKILFQRTDVDDKEINARIKRLANQVREIIEPVTIRRNRKDLQTHPVYQKEIQTLSKLKDPEAAFFELDTDQDKFYNDVLNHFQDPDEGGNFTGAVYRPIFYQQGIFKNIDDYDSDNQEALTQDEVTQTNLYALIRRLLVRRLESSFGAFSKSLYAISGLFKKILELIEKTNTYLFDINTIQKILDLLDDENEDKSPEQIDYEIKKLIMEYEQKYDDKRHRVYYLDDSFKMKGKFIQDIKKDILLIEMILKDFNNLHLIDNDPKSFALNKFITTKFKENLNRKILVFTEFADTVYFLKDKLGKLNPELFNRTLFVAGNISATLKNEIITNFDASYKVQNNDYDLIITTDKLSEGYNLNRAGIVVNYDIPWNPVRVIQRVGRINRIGKKVFDELEIFNFFPTEKGKDHADAKTVAATKMFMIHNILGEDVKIFDPEEEPSPSRLFEILNQNPEDAVEESLYTKVYNEFEKFKSLYPDILDRIYSLPNRSKVVKASNNNDLTVVYRRNRLFVQHFDLDDNNNELQLKEMLFEELLDKIRSTPDVKPLKVDSNFWDKYEKAINFHKKIPLANILSKDGKQARNKLIHILRSFTALPNDLYLFVQDLLDDFDNIGSLSSYTISYIAKINIENIEKLIQELTELRNRLGNDYFSKLKSQDDDNTEKEIVISIMNKKD